MRRIGPARLGALLLLSLVVGLNLILPAGAHVTRRLPHLLKHLDPRYINVEEMAANANLLDGQDSSAFLGANAKAADADLLDGQNSSAFLGASAKAADANLLDGRDQTSFMSGPGKAVKGVLSLVPGSQFPVLFEEGHLELDYACPQTLTDQGTFVLLNQTAFTLNVFVDNGTTNPTYQQVVAGLSVPAAAAGEFLTIQVHAPNVHGSTHVIATMHVMSVHRASDCHVQAQAVISS